MGKRVGRGTNGVLLPFCEGAVIACVVLVFKDVDLTRGIVISLRERA